MKQKETLVAANTVGARLVQGMSILTIVSAVILSGCTGIALTLANAPARFGDYAVTRDIAYGAGKSRLLDVYRPRDAGATARPIIVFMYGGRWTTGSRHQYRFVADSLTARGYVVVIPEYRLYPETVFPGFVEDAAYAVRWSHEHASDFGADPLRLYVMGHSAGAHIAAMLNFDEKYLRAAGGEPSWIRGFIGLAGPYDFLPITDPVLKNVFGPDARYPQSQPINFVDGREPPALLLHGRDDRVAWPRNSAHLAARIREHGGQVKEEYYEDMDHTDILAALSVYYRQRRSVLDEIDAFVK